MAFKFCFMALKHGFKVQPKEDLKVFYLVLVLLGFVWDKFLKSIMIFMRDKDLYLK